MTLILLEASRPQIALQAEMRRVWATMDRMDAESARRVLTAVADMRRDILDRLAALPTVTIDDTETFASTSLRMFADELDEVGARFAQRYSRELGEDMRSVARFSDEAHRAALGQLARGMGVPPSLVSLAPLGVNADQIEAAVLLNQSAVKNVSQAVVSAVNREIQGVVFGLGSRWDAVKNIRTALATEDRRGIGALTKRAETIERTAMIQAFNVAADHAYRQAIEELPDGMVEWVAAPDKRVDPLCVSLNGKRKKPGGTFPGGIYAPPRHPRCRCRVTFWMPDWGSAPLTPQRAIRQPAKPTPIPRLAPTPKAAVVPPVEPGKFVSLAEAERDMKRRYSNITFDFAGAHIDTINPSMRAFHKLSQEYPDVANRLEYVGTTMDPKASSTYGKGFSKQNESTMAYATRDGKAIALNPHYYGKLEALASATKRSVEVGWHPKGTEPVESVMIHEFGHQVQNWAESRGVQQVTKAVWASALGLRTDTILIWLRETKRRAGNIAEYAKKSPQEQFAELFAAHHMQAKPQPVVKQFGHLLEDVVKAPALATGTNDIKWMGRSGFTDEERQEAIFQMRALGRRLGVKWP